MSKILIFGPYTEFNAFNKFNMMIPQLRAGYDEAVIVCPFMAACIMTNADKLICASEPFLAKTGSHYPAVLEKMGTMERYDFGYGHSGFMQRALQEATKLIGACDILLYTDDSEFAHRGYMPPQGGYKTYNRGQGSHYIEDFSRIAANIRTGWSILPFEEDRQAMVERFPFVDSNTYVYMTRNFVNKQPTFYNSTEDDKRNIEAILALGYKVLNFGQPCKPFGINVVNYSERMDSLTYSQQLAMSYMARGMFLRGDAGGFTTHACTMLDLFITTDEWGNHDMFYNPRTSRPDLNTFKVRGDVAPAIRSHIPKTNKPYSKSSGKVLAML